MPSFITRVELHDEADYTRLHKEMERRGFFRTLVGRTGTYRLPTGEYYYEGAREPQNVYNAAVEAVAGTGKTGYILVIQADGPIFFNLKAVEPD